MPEINPIRDIPEIPDKFPKPLPEESKRKQRKEPVKNPFEAPDDKVEISDDVERARREGNVLPEDE